MTLCLCSLSYLKSTAGPRTVPVELGSKYTDHNWSQKLMTVSEFIDDYIVGGAGRPKAYLAQHQLFDQVRHGYQQKQTHRLVYLSCIELLGLVNWGNQTVRCAMYSQTGQNMCKFY